MKNSSGKITVVISCAIIPGMIDMAKRELKSVGRLVMEREEACKGIYVYDAESDPSKLLIVEHWDSKDIFTGQHMETPHMVDFLRLSKTFLDGEVNFSYWNAMQ